MKLEAFKLFCTQVLAFASPRNVDTGMCSASLGCAKTPAFAVAGASLRGNRDRSGIALTALQILEVIVDDSVQLEAIADSSHVRRFGTLTRTIISETSRILLYPL